VIRDVQKKQSPGQIAAKFHNTLCRIIVSVAQSAGISNVVLTGGCFQNKTLTEMTVRALQAKNFTPYWHRHIPPNDGGVSFGQAVAATWSTSDKSPAETVSNDDIYTALKTMERKSYVSTNDQ
ncbi:MAG TPA: hypothetical protein VH255_09430, partial [Verrucomicrobiae bacterium]|jgi:hydrogenase maturation protein HypF|nr:hypothetical protein [Verrucomicrobiae bacterium]